jgi:hypothetical protein
VGWGIKAVKSCKARPSSSTKKLSKNEAYSLPLTLVNGKRKQQCGLQPNYPSGILAKAPGFSFIIPLTKVNGNDFCDT